MKKSHSILVGLYANMASYLNETPLTFTDKTPNNLKNAKDVTPRTEPKKRRNDLCSCSSGIKFKKCCDK